MLRNSCRTFLGRVVEAKDAALHDKRFPRLDIRDHGVHVMRRVDKQKANTAGEACRGLQCAAAPRLHPRLETETANMQQEVGEGIDALPSGHATSGLKHSSPGWCSAEPL